MRGIYQDRQDAGAVLAAEVAKVVKGSCVVAAIPRGGIVVAAPVAERLKAPLTLTYTRKIALPDAPELAVGTLDEDGEAILDSDLIERMGAGGEEVEAARARVRAEIERQRSLYEAPPLAPRLTGNTLVLVDDGLATGFTMRAAIRFARRHGAHEVVVAAPCASSHAARMIEREADRFICMLVDEMFLAVGSYYLEFDPVSDDEVRAVLREAAKRERPAQPALRSSSPSSAAHAASSSRRRVRPWSSSDWRASVSSTLRSRSSPSVRAARSSASTRPGMAAARVA
jgi:predicted phosphoribosyltransferase